MTEFHYMTEECDIMLLSFITLQNNVILLCIIIDI